MKYLLGFLFSIAICLIAPTLINTGGYTTNLTYVMLGNLSLWLMLIFYGIFTGK